jgi:hypothetical protein
MNTNGEWRYNSITLDLGTRWRRGVSFNPQAALPSRERAPVTIGQEAGKAPEPVRTLWRSLACKR